MARAGKLQQQLDAIAACAGDPAGDQSLTLLRQALRSGPPAVAARAAGFAGHYQVREVADALRDCVDRFVGPSPSRDPGGRAALAAIEALDDLDQDATDQFLAGIAFERIEPSYGGPVDVAAPLRARCAVALARTRHQDLFRLLPRLLHDSWRDARIGAVRAAAVAGGEIGEALLRVKALERGEDPEVTGECLSLLMRGWPEDSLDLVAGFLRHGEDRLAELAALALGESGRPEALDALTGFWEEEPDAGRKARVLLPVALLRTEASFSFLFEVVRTGPVPLAVEAVRALEMYRADPEKMAAIGKAALSRGDDRLSALIRP